MKKKSAIFLAVILTLGLTACSSKEDSAENAGAGGETNEVSGETEASGEAIELTYWYWADTTEQSDLMKSIVAEYNATNTMNVTVHAEENAWNGGAYVEDMYVAVAGGGGPDISTFRISGASMFHNGGYLYNCTDLVNGWEDKGALADSIWESISESTGTPGEYYSVPWTYETLYVY